MRKLNIPPDLALVIFLTVLCIPFVLIPPLNEISPVRIILGLPLVLFLPGYALIATLFPRKDDPDGIERIALSFGLSIAITPLLGFALNYTPFGIRLTPVLTVLSVFTIALAIGAWARRSRIPDEDRFVVDVRAFFRSIGLFKSMPKEGEKFTEFYVLGLGGMAEEYPTNLTVGEEGEVIIGVVNHEYATVTYPLELKLNGEVIDQKSILLAHNETWEGSFTFKPMKKGAIVVLESTIYPGVSEEIIAPILERESELKCGSDFKIGYSPERINPGDEAHALARITKTVAGMEDKTTEILAELYGLITNVYKAKDIRTAEAAKVIENIQRDLNIALMNDKPVLIDVRGLFDEEEAERREVCYRRL